MQDKEFEAAGVRTHVSHDGSEVRLGFYDEDDRERAVTLKSDHIPALLSQLQSRIGPGTVRPMSAHGMPAGTVFRLIGKQTGAQRGGGALLTLHLKVEDGARTVPINLPPDELRHLINELSDYL